MEKYVAECGSPYKCDIDNCINSAKWRIKLSNTKTLLVCDEHKQCQNTGGSDVSR